MKHKATKTLNIIELILGGIIVLCLIGTLILQLIDLTSSVSIWIADNIWNVSESIESLKAQLPTIIQSIIYIFLVLAISKQLRTIFKSQISKSDRAKTVVQLFDGLVKYASAIFIIILVLKACGVDTGALIASVGVLTLIVAIIGASLAYFSVSTQSEKDSLIVQAASVQIVYEHGNKLEVKNIIPSKQNIAMKTYSRWLSKESNTEGKEYQSPVFHLRLLRREKSGAGAPDHRRGPRPGQPWLHPRIHARTQHCGNGRSDHGSA